MEQGVVKRIMQLISKKNITYTRVYRIGYGFISLHKI